MGAAVGNVERALVVGQNWRSKAQDEDACACREGGRGEFAFLNEHRNL